MNNLSLWICLLCLATFSNSEKVTITCRSNTTACPNRVQYSYSGPNNPNSSQCGKKNQCSFTTTQQLQVFKCDKDFYGMLCDAKVCYYPTSNVQCFDEAGFPCEKIGIQAVKCGNCNNANCQSNKCITRNEKQACYPSSQCQFQSVYTNYSQCSGGKDFLGNNCNCCGRLYGQGQVGQCLSGEDFQSQKFKNFASNYKNTFNMSSLNLITTTNTSSNIIPIIPSTVINTNNTTNGTSTNSNTKTNNTSTSTNTNTNNTNKNTNTNNTSTNTNGTSTNTNNTNTNTNTNGTNTNNNTNKNDTNTKNSTNTKNATNTTDNYYYPLEGNIDNNQGFQCLIQMSLLLLCCIIVTLGLL